MKNVASQLSQLQRDFINRYQGGFPIVEQPFEVVANELGCSESKLISTIKNLKENKVLTRFGPLYDAAQLGGGLTLAAMSVPEDRFEIVTQIVNSYPEVAHNYRREHKLNMWFVVATETPIEIVQIISSIEKTTNLTVYNFPKKQEFYIGLRCNVREDGVHETISFSDSMPTDSLATDISASGSTTSASTASASFESTSSVPIQQHFLDFTLSELDRKIIKQTQSGLPITPKPYHKIANNINCNVQDVIEHLSNMLSHGVIRRIGAVPNHFRLGFEANGMTVWDVPDELIIELGKQIGRLDFVSHCYQRPRHLPLWRYNLFAMVHGHNRDVVNEKTRQIKQILGENCRAHEILYSTEILKKTGLRLAA